MSIYAQEIKNLEKSLGHQSLYSLAVFTNVDVIVIVILSYN